MYSYFPIALADVRAVRCFLGYLAIAEPSIGVSLGVVLSRRENDVPIVVVDYFHDFRFRVIALILIALLIESVVVGILVSVVADELGKGKDDTAGLHIGPVVIAFVDVTVEMDKPLSVIGVDGEELNLLGSCDWCEWHHKAQFFDYALLYARTMPELDGRTICSQNSRSTPRTPTCGTRHGNIRPCADDRWEQVR